MVFINIDYKPLRVWGSSTLLLTFYKAKRMLDIKCKVKIGWKHLKLQYPFMSNTIIKVSLNRHKWHILNPKTLWKKIDCWISESLLWIRKNQEISDFQTPFSWKNNLLKRVRAHFAPRTLRVKRRTTIYFVVRNARWARSWIHLSLKFY